MNTGSHSSSAVLLQGDATERLAQMPDASVDAVVTDPPYALSAEPAVTEMLADWLTEGAHDTGTSGFMGHRWDGFMPGPAVWRECLRVLRPGGHLVAFAAPRTQDLLGIALRIAGFEVRDTLMWVFGTGFPKSMNVAKQLDKAGGRDVAESARRLAEWREGIGMSRAALAATIGCSESSIRDWEEGRARTSGGPVEFMVPSEPYRARLNALFESYGTDERTVTATSKPRAGDGTVFGLGHTGVLYGEPSSELAKKWEGWGTQLKPGYEPILLARRPPEGTIAGNVVAHGTGAINIDGCRNPILGSDEPGRFPANVVLSHDPFCVLLGERTVRSDSHHPASRGGGGLGTAGHGGQDGLAERAPGTEVIEHWMCAEGCPVADLDAQSGSSRSGDAGGASRFFYVAKASAAERRVGLDGEKNPHPTVKPVELMRWLVRLVTPPGGVVLDPFCGSGSTLVAASREGVSSIGVDRDDDGLYLDVARRRLEHEGVAVELDRSLPAA